MSITPFQLPGSFGLACPRTERQARFMAMADALAAEAATRAELHDRENSFPFATFQALQRAGYLVLTVPEED